MELGRANAVAYSSLAVALTRAGDLEKAISAAKQALALNPKDPLTESNLAVALIQTGRTDEAVEHVRKALDLDPDFSDAHNMLGIALAWAGKLDDAVEHLWKAVSNTPDSLEYRFNLGRVLAARHSFAEAAPQFEKAVEAASFSGSAIARARRAVLAASAKRPNSEYIAASISRLWGSFPPERLRARIAYYEGQH